MQKQLKILNGISLDNIWKHKNSGTWADIWTAYVEKQLGEAEFTSEVGSKLGTLLTLTTLPKDLKKLLVNTPGLSADEVRTIFRMQSNNRKSELIKLAKKKLAIQYGVDVGIIAPVSITTMNQTPQVLQVPGIPTGLTDRFAVGKVETTKKDLEKKMQEMTQRQKGISELKGIIERTQLSKLPEATKSQEEYFALGFYSNWKHNLSDEILGLEQANVRQEGAEVGQGSPREESGSTSPTSSLGEGSEDLGDVVSTTGSLSNDQENIIPYEVWRTYLTKLNPIELVQDKSEVFPSKPSIPTSDFEASGDRRQSSPRPAAIRPTWIGYKPRVGGKTPSGKPTPSTKGMYKGQTNPTNKNAAARSPGTKKPALSKQSSKFAEKHSRTTAGVASTSSQQPVKP